MQSHHTLSGRSRRFSTGLRMLACAGLVALLTACGFRLKGETPLPFTTLYTNIGENTAFGANLRRAILASSPETRFTSDVSQAQARLTELANVQSLDEVSISVQGQVEEYEVRIDFTFQLTDARGHVVLPPTTLTAIREIPYDSSALQAKQGEINRLYAEMQQGLIDRVVRRITAPDVREAFENPDDLPVDAEAVKTPQPPVMGSDGNTPSILRMPNTSPSGGFY
ncbi:MAG: LPS assembly lipoprotein LptE [Pusillimonas sp.]